MACEFPKSALTGFGANSLVRKFLNIYGSSESWRPNLRLWALEEFCVVTNSSDWLVTSINCILTSLVCLKTQNSVPEKETRPWCFPFIEYSPNNLLTQNSSPPLVTQTCGEKMISSHPLRLHPALQINLILRLNFQRLSCRSFLLLPSSSLQAPHFSHP